MLVVLLRSNMGVVAINTDLNTWNVLRVAVITRLGRPGPLGYDHDASDWQPAGSHGEGSAVWDRYGIENSCRSSYRLVQVLNACPLVEGHLQRAGVLRNKSFAAVARLICSRGVVWLTYTMPNVGAWKTLGEYSSFDTMPSRNVVCWTAMILGHVKRGRG
ncbi:unnamed protein product [Sphagnum jensenii]|uniref:Uncharacterized protein n=1 Tax=Sphagnum jensenii TaxID=128206 RepID=A0ABP1AX14_9BRYO